MTPHLIAGSSAVLIALGCAAHAQNSYTQVNLVSNLPELEPQILDPNLLDAWGIALSAPGDGSRFWINNAGSGTSTVYFGDTPAMPLHQEFWLRSIDVPSSVLYAPFPETVSQPTGLVFNGSETDFMVSGEGLEGPSEFIFVTLDGSVSGWTRGMHTSVNMYDNSLSGAMYTGVAVTPFAEGNRLYIADFGLEEVTVLDHEFKPVGVPGTFHDAQLPDAYTPWNLQYIDGLIYIAFARQGDDPGEEDQYPGYGRIAAFDLDGNLVRRFEPRLELNAPWGMSIAPATFGPLAGTLLVSNFADGTIVAYDPATGSFIDYLRGPDGAAVQVDGLWGIAFGDGVQLGYANHLYFAAGPNGEEDGLLGKLVWRRSADLNDDGARDMFDFLEFTALFSADDLRADFDDDANLAFPDFLAFINAFNE